MKPWKITITGELHTKLQELQYEYKLPNLNAVINLIYDELVKLQNKDVVE